MGFFFSRALTLISLALGKLGSPDFSRLSSTEFIRCTSETTLNWKFNVFIVSFKLKYFFSINKQITIISIEIQTQTFVLALLKLTLKFFSGELKTPSIPKVGPSASTENLFSRLSAWDDELLSTPKIIAFLAVPSSKLYEPALSSAIP